MARIPAGAKDTVPAEFQGAFDQAVGRIGGPASGGPWPVMLNSPELALRRIQLADYLRKESTFPKKIQELAILIAVRAMDCQYAWLAHAATARREGVSDALVDAIYYICDFSARHGINLDPLFDIVHGANMQKVIDGKVIKREDGKILKPEGWEDPSLKLEVEMQRQSSEGGFAN